MKENPILFLENVYVHNVLLLAYSNRKNALKLIWMKKRL